MNEQKTPPVADPGLEEHEHRFTDVDEAAADRAYRQIVRHAGLRPGASSWPSSSSTSASRRTPKLVLFGANFKMQTTLLGLTGGLATLMIGVAAIAWARSLMSDEEIVGERHGAASPPEARERVLADLETGIEASGHPPTQAARHRHGRCARPDRRAGPGQPRRPRARGPPPALRAETLEKTIWAEGIRLVNDVNYLPLKASELQVGQLVNAVPANLEELHGAEHQSAKAKAAIIIVRMDPNSIKIPDSRKDWQVDGILCYSKICTHVGCPISLWEQQTHHLLCPCHQSTFDLGNSGVVVFGPAARSLPQLPITTDAEGYLIARSDFTVPVGPSYFERDSSKDYKEGDR